MKTAKLSIDISGDVYCTRRSLSRLSKTPYPRKYKPKDY